MTQCPGCGKVFEEKLSCLRCGHDWKPRGDGHPKVCPSPDCKSPYWDRPRKNRGRR